MACPICMDPLASEPTWRCDSCNKAVHLTCMISYFTPISGKPCPLCREPFDPKHYAKFYDMVEEHDLCKYADDRMQDALDRAIRLENAYNEARAREEARGRRDLDSELDEDFENPVDDDGTPLAPRWVLPYCCPRVGPDQGMAWAPVRGSNGQYTACWSCYTCGREVDKGLLQPLPSWFSGLCDAHGRRAYTFDFSNGRRVLCCLGRFPLDFVRIRVGCKSEPILDLPPDQLSSPPSSWTSVHTLPQEEYSCLFVASSSDEEPEKPCKKARTQKPAEPDDNMEPLKTNTAKDHADNKCSEASTLELLADFAAEPASSSSSTSVRAELRTLERIASDTMDDPLPVTLPLDSDICLADFLNTLNSQDNLQDTLVDDTQDDTQAV